MFGLIYCLHSKSLGTDFCSNGRQRMGQVKCSLLQRGNCVCALQHGAPALLASNSCNLQGCRTNCQNVRGAARTRHHCVFFDNRNRQWTKDCQGAVPAGAPIAQSEIPTAFCEVVFCILVLKASQRVFVSLLLIRALYYRIPSTVRLLSRGL